MHLTHLIQPKLHILETYIANSWRSTAHVVRTPLKVHYEGFNHSLEVCQFWATITPHCGGSLLVDPHPM